MNHINNFAFGDRSAENIKVMIVEDEAVVALDINHRLTGLGYEVVGTAASGEEALKLAADIRPDVILMDIMLEGEMDGIQTAAAIGPALGVPVIYLTAYSDDETLQRAKVTEPFGYVIKPFENREIRTNIEMACYKHKMERAKREADLWLAATLHSIADAIVSTDARGRVTFMNEIAQDLVGMGMAQALGRDLDGVLRVSGDMRDKAGEGLLDPVLGSGRFVGSDDMYLTLPNGRELPVEIFGNAIRDEGGRPVGAVLAFRDISARKRSEQALRNSMSDLRRTLDETVHALGLTGEKRDPYTAGHQQRVSRLACAIARKIHLPEDAIEGIRVAGLLHDLGKIYIPAEILAKPASLTNMEFGMMKTHPEVGSDILRRIPFPWPVADMVVQHHERLDGSGYPLGLARGGILEEAKIIAVADVVEAMSSHRPYRAAKGLEAALGEIARGRGVCYETRVVDACLDLFENDGFGLD